MGQTKAQAKAKEFGYGWKAAGKVLLKREQREIMSRYDTCTAEELAAKVAEAMTFLAESYVELESVTYPYDDGEYPSLRVVGFRPATEKEIAEKQAEVD